MADDVLAWADSLGGNDGTPKKKPQPDNLLDWADSIAPTPSKYDNLFEKHAQANGIDPDLLRAMTNQESTFHPKAISPKGAQGLMQLMPGTARRFKVSNVYDPDQNIRGGAQYMRFLLDRYNGNVPKALAGYNAGEGAVDKYKGIPPFRETRNYVKKITGKYKGTGYAPAVDENSVWNDVDSLLGGPTKLPPIIPQPPPEPTQTLQTPPDIAPLPAIAPPVPVAQAPVQPLVEAPATIEAQITSMMDQKSPRSAVLLTDDVQRPLLANMSGVSTVKLPEGTLVVNSKKLGIKPADIPAYVKKNGFASLIGKVEDHPDTTTGIAVRTEDANGNELATSRVTPENVQAQATLDKQQFPQAANHEVVTPPVAVAKRADQLTREAQPPAFSDEPVISDVPEPQPQTAFPRIPGNAPISDDSVLGVAQIDPKWSDEQKVRVAANQVLRKYDVTPQEIDKWIADSKAAKIPLVKGTGKGSNFTIKANMLAQIKGPDYVRNLAAQENAQRERPSTPANYITGTPLQQIRGLTPEEVTQENLNSDPLYAQAVQNIQADPNAKPEDVQAEYQRLQSNQRLNQQQAIDAHAGDSQLKANVIGAGGAGFNLGAGMLHFINQIPSATIVGDPNNPSFTQWAERRMRELGGQMSGVEQSADERNKDSGWLNEYLVNPTEKTLLAIPRFVSLPGGIVAQLGADAFLQDVGRKGSVDTETLKTTGKAIAQGAILHGAGVIGESWGKIARTAAVSGGTGALAALTGEKPEDAFKEMVKMAIIDAGFQVFEGKKVQATDGEHSRLVTVSPDGEVLELKNQQQKPDAVVDVSEVKQSIVPKTNEPQTKIPQPAAQMGEKPLVSNQPAEVPTEPAITPGIEYAKRPDGTLKKKNEYTPEEWKAYTDSAIKQKLEAQAQKPPEPITETPVVPETPTAETPAPDISQNLETYKKAFELPLLKSTKEAKYLGKQIDVTFETESGKTITRQVKASERHTQLENKGKVLNKLLDCLHG